MKMINVLGATGSIGTQTVDVVLHHPESFRIVSMSFGNNIEKGRELVRACQPEFVSVAKKKDADLLKLEFPNIQWSYGEEGLLEAAVYDKGNVLVNAVMGSIGLQPTLAAIEVGKTICLANKETLVTAGHLVMEQAKKHNVPIVPVDSEHSAILQALQGENRDRVERLWITASGGSFRDRTRQELEGVTIEDALHHPNWSMGAKITIDSATMMNKGLEVIEARWLFDMPYENISVLLHKESIVHSLVEYVDTSFMAQLGTPDMRAVIQYALSYPDRLPLIGGERLRLEKIATLNFEKMDFDRYPCLHFAFEAGKIGGTCPTVLNAANEVAVEAFLQGAIPFLQIENVIERMLEEHSVLPSPDLETIQHVDKDTRERVRSLLK
ncbi:1-deoxy-D-xylulose-5-phosphate reductoisomerase [Bacillus fonticola]|uniref:1-deoxy-D-xylulose-5-phosphate reductoisomerase n=1 Tax=Bacillus fonticola TaxID=2728853 RepID=UPI00147519DC|nr:1-deoxy-D-xylulose-5-phosphate reductoisomerase [Bacillus fonticola]